MPTLGCVSEFAVEVSSLQQVASATAAIGADLAAELAELRGIASEVLSAGWQGSAAAAFDRRWLEWDEAAQSIMRALDDLAEQVALSARSYALRDVEAATALMRAAS